MTADNIIRYVRLEPHRWGLKNIEQFSWFSHFYPQLLVLKNQIVIYFSSKIVARVTILDLDRGESQPCSIPSNSAKFFVFRLSSGVTGKNNIQTRKPVLGILNPYSQTCSRYFKSRPPDLFSIAILNPNHQTCSRTLGISNSDPRPALGILIPGLQSCFRYFNSRPPDLLAVF